MHNHEIFCDILTTRYRIHSFTIYQRLQIEHYIVQNVRKQRLFDQYINNMCRHVRACNIIDVTILIAIYENFDKKLKRDILKFIEYISIDEFNRNLEKTIDY